MDIKDRVKRGNESDKFHFAGITENNEGVALIKIICEHNIFNTLAMPDTKFSAEEERGMLRAYRQIIVNIEAFQTDKEAILRARREKRKDKKEEEELSKEPEPEHTGSETI